MSSGNHAAVLLYLLNQFNIKGMIYMPENAFLAKVDVLKAYGPNLKFYGTDVSKTEEYAREMAIKNHQILVPSYNHPKIIAGQATVTSLIKQKERFKNKNVALVISGKKISLDRLKGILCQ